MNQTNFRDWAGAKLNTKPDWKPRVMAGLAYIGACTLIALILIWAGA
jgi:hypothetical protein